MLSLAFLAITFLSLVLFYLGTGRNKKVLLVGCLWAFAVGLLSYTGFFRDTHAFPPRILYVIVPVVIYLVYLYRKWDQAMLRPRLLLSVHSLRLPVELVLYQLYMAGKVPVIMTFKGCNFDILAGISAILLLCYLGVTQKKISVAVWTIWNILGLLSLVAIVSIALLSAPLPLQQLAFDQPNIAVLEFPYTLLPAVVVPVVLLSHLLGLKIRRRESGPTHPEIS